MLNKDIEIITLPVAHIITRDDKIVDFSNRHAEVAKSDHVEEMLRCHIFLLLFSISLLLWRAKADAQDSNCVADSYLNCKVLKSKVSVFVKFWHTFLFRIRLFSDTVGALAFPNAVRKARFWLMAMIITGSSAFPIPIRICPSLPFWAMPLCITPRPKMSSFLVGFCQLATVTTMRIGSMK